MTKVVAVVGILSASYESNERAFVFANRLIGRNAFQPAAMAAACAATKDATSLLASVHLYYDDTRSCAYLLGIIRPESQCFDRDASTDVASFERERFKVQLLLHTCSNLLFILQETARLPLSLLKDARALASEKQQVLTQLQTAPTSAKASKKSSNTAVSSVFVPGRCVPLVLFVVPAPDEVQFAVSTTTKSASNNARAPLAMYCKALEAKLTSLFRSLRAGLVGSVRMRDALTATNLSKERRVFNLDPSHCAVVVSGRTATATGGLDTRLQDLFDSLDVDFCDKDARSSTPAAATDLDTLLQPLEDDDIGFSRASQVLTRFVDMLLAAAGSVASAPPASSSSSSGGGNKDVVRVDLLTLAHWLKAFHTLVKTMHRMDAKRRQDTAQHQTAFASGAVIGGGEQSLLYQCDHHADFL